jgi:hypothetical protein
VNMDLRGVMGVSLRAAERRIAAPKKPYWRQSTRGVAGGSK